MALIRLGVPQAPAPKRATAPAAPSRAVLLSPPKTKPVVLAKAPVVVSSVPVSKPVAVVATPPAPVLPPAPVAEVAKPATASPSFLNRFAQLRGTRLLVPVAVAVISLVALGFVMSRPVSQATETTQLSLSEGESKMVTIAFPVGGSPEEFKTPQPEVAEASIFLLQEQEGFLHVLVTGVRAGETSWNIVTSDGKTRYFQTRVAPMPVRPLIGDRQVALRKIEEGDHHMKEAEREPANAWQAHLCYSEACEILGAVPYGKVDPIYARASSMLEQARRLSASHYQHAEGELAVAKLNGDAKAIRTALLRMQQIMPDERSAEYQKTATLLNYVYSLRKTKKGKGNFQALMDEPKEVE